MEERQRRKLAVILHADVVGSTLLVQKNESLAHARIQDAFQRFSLTIEAYSGVTHELRGDALVAEFARASDAVSAALAFQIENTEANATLEDDLQPRLRIGISLGEVVIADNTVTGAGVVLAQRVEQLAEPGGVCITGAVHEAVPQHLSLDYSDLGKKEAKGFEEPVQVYRAALQAGAQLSPPESTASLQAKRRPSKRLWTVSAIAVVILVFGVIQWWQPWVQRVELASVERMAFPLPEKPSIAVLSFGNLSGDPSQDYFVDGFTEDLITELSRFTELFVISGTSTFTYKNKNVKVRQVAEELGVRYVLEGSVRRTEVDLLITARLVDAISGVHIWAERYQGPLSDFRALEAEVLHKIVSTVAGRLEGVGRRIASRKQTDNLSAYELVLQGDALVKRQVESSNEQARVYFEKAIALDAQYARAHSGLGETHIWDYLYGWSEDSSSSLNRAREAILQSISLDDGNSHALWGLGWIYIYEGQVDEGVALIEKAISLNPNDAQLLANSGYALTFQGEFQKAINHVQQAMRLNPFHLDYYYDALGWAYYFLGQYDAALRAMIRIAKPNAGQHRLFAAIYARLGQMEKAKDHARRVLDLEPGFALSIFARTMSFKDSAVLERYLEGLKLAGLPEHPALSLPDKPSIAVLPFANMSDDPKQEYFVDGMTDDLITDLSKVSGLFVISRNSVFVYKDRAVNVQQVSKDLGVAYVLEGSIRRVGEKVRINVQLVDASTSGHVWAERYDRDLKDIFALQNEVVNKIVSALAVKLSNVEESQLARLPTQNLEAYDYFLRAEQGLYSQDTKGLDEALSFYREATSLDPAFVRAWAGHARAAVEVWRLDWFDVMPGHIARKYAYESAGRALALDSENARAYSVLAVLQMVDSRYDEAVDSARKAVSLQPNDADAHLNLALVLAYSGMPDEAVAVMRTALRLDPRPPPGVYRVAGLILFMDRQYESAIQLLKKTETGLSDAPHEELAMAYAQLGRVDEARVEVDGLLEAWPAANLSYYRVLYSHHKRAEDLEFRLEALRKAGLPEWPYGLEGREVDRVEGNEIERLLYDRVWDGYRKGGEGFVRENTKDGLVMYRDPAAHGGRSRSAYMLIGKASVEGNMLCYQYSQFLLGRKYCGYVYLNPNGSRRKKNEYVDVNAISIDFFAAGPERRRDID